MRAITITLVLCISYIISFSQSIDPGFSKKPNASALEGFEKQAMNKIIEFAEYQDIIANKSYDITLREHAYEQGVKLFDDKDVNRINPRIIGSRQKNMLPGEFLKFMMRTDNDSISTTISDTEVVKHFTEIDEETYKGQITFVRKCEYYKDGKIDKTFEHKQKALIILKKVKKDFGDDEKYVWNTFLGNIE